MIRAVAFALPAIEMVDSRIADWKIGILDTIADNASSGFTCSARTPKTLDGLDLRTGGHGDGKRRASRFRPAPARPASAIPVRGAVAGQHDGARRATLESRRHGAVRRARADGRGQARATFTKRASTASARCAQHCEGARHDGARYPMRDHRLRQYRHRSDDQGDAHVEASGDGRDGRHRSRIRRPGARRAPRRARDARRASTACASCRITRTSRSCSTPPRPARISRNNAILQQRRQEGDRPDAGGDRALHHSGGQRRRQSRRAERQHGHLRRPGDDPDGRARCAASPNACIYGEIVASISSKSAGPGHARQHRRIHRNHVEGDRRARRRRARQGDHHAQSRRAAADHARHRVRAVAGRDPARRSSSRSATWSPPCRNTCRAIA